MPSFCEPILSREVACTVLAPPVLGDASAWLQACVVKEQAVAYITSGTLCCGEADSFDGFGVRAKGTVALQAAKEAELAAVRARIEAALGAGVSGKRLADLMSLAQFQMLSRDARAFRSPTVVLSMRPQRSVTMRCVPPVLLMSL